MADNKKKNILLTAFLGLATLVIIMSSCANDTGDGSATEHPATIPDSSVTKATEATAPTTIIFLNMAS